MNPHEHWNRIYLDKSATGVSWYTPHLARSLELIREAQLPKSASILDVGGGASTLAADLLTEGFQHIAVLDIAQAALDVAKASLGDKAQQVTWLAGDITTAQLPEAAYDLWHDRAVFHFLTEEAQRRAYIRQVERALKTGGRIIVATFGTHGPERCSGLEVVHYDEASLPSTFGAHFERLHCLEETHTTPWGTLQEFVYCLCRKLDEPEPQPTNAYATTGPSPHAGQQLERRRQGWKPTP